MLLLDTSVVVAFYIPEANSHRVQRLFSSDTALAISALAQVEFTSAIARLVRMKSIGETAGRRVLEKFESHVRQKLYAFSPITPETYDLARHWLGSFTTALRNRTR